MRSEALAAGVSGMSIYDQLKSRVEAACKQSEDFEVWCSKILKGMRVTEPSKATMNVMLTLIATVEAGTDRHHMNRIYRRVPILVAQVMRRADEAREAKAARKALP